MSIQLQGELLRNITRARTIVSQISQIRIINTRALVTNYSHKICMHVILSTQQNSL